MHLACPGGAHHRDEAARGGAAHDRVIDHDDALSAEHFAHGVVLDLHLGVASGLRGLDEGASHVVIADERELEGQARCLGEAERGRVRGIGDAEHEVGTGRRELPPQSPAQRAARAVDRAAEDAAVGSREVDVLEDAAMRLALGKGEDAAHSGAVHGHDLAALHVTDVRGADDVEGARLGGEHHGVAEGPHHERPPPDRVARREERVA